MMRQQMRHRGCSMNNFEFSKREVLCSIVIIFLFALVGFFIDGKICDRIDEGNEVYLRATRIENSPEQFDYALRTGFGDTLISGQIQAVNPVSFSELTNNYLAVQKVREEYTRHTRVVSYRVGKTTHRRTEIYYTWDRKGTTELSAEQVTFCGIKFPTDTFDINAWSRLSLTKDTVRQSNIGDLKGNYLYEDKNTRYYFYVIPTTLTGTVFASLHHQMIEGTAKFYWGNSIDEVVSSHLQTATGYRIFFWIIWIFLCCAVIFGFAYFENKWLE